MDRNFSLNWFHFSNPAEYIQNIEVLPNVITDIDNLAQNDSKQEYEKHAQFEVKSFQCVDSKRHLTKSELKIHKKKLKSIKKFSQF